MSKIVVYGVTGYAGGNIADELVSRGHQVTGIARDASGAPASVEARSGSITDASLLREVAAGADHIVVALPASPRGEGDVALIDALPTLTEVAIAAGTRLSFVGGAGSLHVSEGGPQLFTTADFPDAYRPEALAHAAVLDALRSSDRALDWFYVSPAANFGSWNAGERTGTFRVGEDVLLTDPDGVSAISGADYAIAFVDEIENRAHHRKRITVAY